MASLPNPQIVTYAQWLNMPEVDGREEVVNGVIHLMPPNKSWHARIARELARRLEQQLDLSKFEVFSQVFGLVIRKQPLTCRNPDIAVFELASTVEERGYFHSAPKLAVEVISPSESRRWKEDKLRDYESIGLPEVWIISYRQRTVEVLTLESGKYCRPTVLRQGILKAVALPHVEIDIAQIWPH
jgi:Uma2 family endonuclease